MVGRPTPEAAGVREEGSPRVRPRRSTSGEGVLGGWDFMILLKHQPSLRSGQATFCLTWNRESISWGVSSFEYFGELILIFSLLT